MRRVVVTGMGVISPIGNDVHSFWESLVKGVNGIGPITKFDTTDFRVKIAAEVKDFPTSKYFDKQEAKKLELFSQYALAAAIEAMDDSGINGKIDPKRLGVYVGSGVGGMPAFIENTLKLNEKGPERVSAFLITSMIANIAAAHIAIKYNAKGPCLPIVTACATATHSIGEAFLAIQSRRADAVIAGGTEAAINGLSIAGFTNCMALSTVDDVNAASVPFDKRRAGFVMGEGSGIVILEEYEHAKKRNAKIYAEIVGYANTCDAFHVTAPSPDALGSIEMLQLAIDMAQIKDTEKIYINPHGTGTPFNDKTETLAIKTAFGEKRAKLIPCSSTKSMTGHLLGAAGGIEAIAAVLALDKKTIPPTINLNVNDPDCDLDYVPHKARKYEADVSLSMSLGFGGHNAVLVFRRIKE